MNPSSISLPLMQTSAGSPGSLSSFITMIVTLGLTGLLVARIAFAIHLRNLVRKCSEDSRTVKPGLAWLLVVPLLSGLATIPVLLGVCRTAETECTRRNLSTGMAATRSIGLSYGILQLVAAIVYIVYMVLLGASMDYQSQETALGVGAVGVLIFLAAFCLWVIFWARSNSHSRRLGTLVFKTVPTVPDAQQRE
jgi:hypothetical protein